jgi:probable HAF family extracellular repeat protein
MKIRTTLCATLLAISLAAAAQTPARHQHQTSRRTTMNLLDIPAARPKDVSSVYQSEVPPPDLEALGSARSKSYVFSTVDYPGAAYSLVLDTNLSTAVGAFAYDNGTTFHSFTLKGTAYKELVVPGATQSYATGINTSGQIVGVSYDPSGATHGFFDNAGAFTAIDYPGAVVTTAVGLNDSGQIVGRYVDSAAHGFLYKSGVFTSINFPGSIGTSAAGSTPMEISWATGRMRPRSLMATC